MSRTAFLSLALFGACSSKAPVPPSSRAAPPTLEAAHAAERGIGGPRDYEKSARIYEALCDGGRGSIEACLELVDAIADARGTSRDVQRVRKIGDALCKRGEPTSCVQNAYIDEMTRPHDSDAEYMGHRETRDDGSLERAFAALEKA